MWESNAGIWPFLAPTKHMREDVMMCTDKPPNAEIATNMGTMPDKPPNKRSAKLCKRKLRVWAQINHWQVSATHHSNCIGFNHFEWRQNSQIRHISQHVNNRHQWQWYVDGSGQILERITQFFGHKIQIIPTGKRENTWVEGNCDFAGIRVGIFERFFKVLQIA